MIVGISGVRVSNDAKTRIFKLWESKISRVAMRISNDSISSFQMCLGVRFKSLLRDLGYFEYLNLHFMAGIYKPKHLHTHRVKNIGSRKQVQLFKIF